MTSKIGNTSYTELVIVACHAIYLGDPASPSCDVFSPEYWRLQPFQQPSGSKPGEHETFLQHIQAGLHALTSGSIKDASILVFSGGATARNVTLMSEARSYFNAAVALTKRSAHGRPCAECLKSRILLEEEATDSYQNLLFSILKFRKATGRYPQTIRVITHAFKAERFLDRHAKAIRWPRDRLRIQGIDPIMSATEYAETVAGEKERGLLPWTEDLYGRRAPLTTKRAHRGWQNAFLDGLGEGLEEEVKALLQHDGGKDGRTVYEGSLPWSSSGN